jgi:hypothetical protein
MKEFFIGLDLGQAQDPTAVAILERIPVKLPPGTHPSRDVYRYQCEHIERLPLGTRYPDIVDFTAKLLQWPEIKQNESTLVIDATGVGAPVADLFTQARIPFTGVIITGGDTVNREGSMYRVPKRILVSTLQVILQGERLDIAPHSEREALLAEMQNFRVSVTEAANDTYGGRSGTHDDMVLAVALAAWIGERGRGARVYSF